MYHVDQLALYPTICFIHSFETRPGMSTVYYTALTHSVTLTQLEHLPRALLCVNQAGIIEWIEKDVQADEVERVLAEHGAEGVNVVRTDGGGLVPGLVDTHTVSYCL